MRVTCILLWLCLTIVCLDGRRRRNHDDETEDFEFADESQTEYELQSRWDQSGSSSSEFFAETTGQPTETPNPTPLSYCSMVRCPSGTQCVLKDFTAICVQDKAKKSPDSSEDVDHEEEEEAELIKEREALETENYKGMIGCSRCPIRKSSFICASDNKTYSSSCWLNFHNCVQNRNIQVICMGFCPCNVAAKLKQGHKLIQANHRWSKFVNKYKMTVSKISQKNEGHGMDGDSDKSGNSLNKNKNVMNPNLAEDKEKQQGHNSVLAEKIPSDRFQKKDCSQKDLEVMGNRLLDWLSIVMSDAKRNKSRRRTYGLSPATFPGYCKQEVKWMFHHLDQNSDAYLSLKELYDLEHDSHEQCIKPFLDRCDINKDMLISSQEWCKCFDRTERPCSAARNRIRSGLVGAYNPECDELGYYKRTQCHSTNGFCWCVDKHGVEYANTRIRGRRPDCDTIVGKSESEERAEFGDEEGDNEEMDDDDDDDNGIESFEGSADRPLDI